MDHSLSENNCFGQPWWLGSRASALHSVESRSLIPQWLESRLGMYDEEILNKKELYPAHKFWREL